MKNVQLHYSGSIKKVKNAVNKANEVLSSDEFYNQIKAYYRFDNSTLSPEVISDLMQDSGQLIEVSVNWIIPTAKTRHDRINLSAWDFSSQLGTAVNTLIYETVFSMDRLHALRNNPGQMMKNSLTASILIGTIAEVMVTPKNSKTELI